jgi:hypothetical protein
MDYGDQEAFYEFVLSKYQEKVQTAINDGTYEFADRFEDYQAEYREEIELAKGRGNKLGFAGGAWLVKFLAKVNFKAQTAKEVDELVEKNLDADYSIPDEWMEVAVTKPVNEATALANDYFENRYNAKEGANLEEMDSHKEAVLDVFEKASKYLLGEESYLNVGDYQLTNIAQQVSTVKENLAKGTISDKLDKEGELTQNYNTVMQKMNTLVRMAKEKEEHDKLLAQMIIGETAQYDKGEGVTAIQHYGTVTNIVREVPEEGLETKSPFATGRITIDLSVNKPGVGANESGTLKQPLSRFAAYNITPVSDFYLGRPDELSAEQRQTIYKVYHEERAERAQSKEKWIAVGNPLAAVQELVNLGQYIQFTDYSGRRLYGIEMTEKAVQDAGGISGLVKGNVEITDGAPWAEYVRDNPYDELSVKFGIHTRSQNIQIKRDQSDDSMMRFIFKPSAYRKLDDADLQSLMKGLNVKDREVTKKDERTGKDEKSREFVISISDSGPLVSKIAERSRLVVLNSNKHKLADYIEIPGAVKATGNERKVPVNEVQEYVFENGIKAIRGTRKNAKDGALKSGFYVTGLGSKPVSDIASISGLKGAPDTEFAGLPFIMEFEWEKGTPFHGMEGKEGLGSPLMNESTTISGGKFSVAAQATEAPTTTMADAQAELVSLPQRLKRLLTVVQSETDLPKGLQLKIKARGVSGNVRGAFHGGRIYIIADALGSREEAMMVWLHEAVGHLGIQKIMGEDLDALLDQIAKAYPQQMRELGKKYKVNIHTKSGRREVAEEILAHAAESGDKPTLMQQIRALFRKLMRKLGFDLMLNDDDIRALLSAAQKAVYNSGFDMDEQMAGPTRYSIRSRSATDEAPSTRLPNDSVIQGIRDGQPVDAVFRGIWKVAEATQLPRAVRVTSAASLRAATNFYDQKMPWAHPTMNYLAKALIDQHGLSEEYKRTKAHMSSKIAVLLDEVRDIIEVISHTAKTEADFKKIQEILVNEAPREEAWDAVTEPIRKRIEELGQEAVNYGLITQESYDRNKGAYLHRVYTKYEQERTSLEKWADGVAAKRYRIVGEETMERGRSIYPTEEKLLETLDPADIEVGKTVYKISRMSANGQRAIKTYYSDKPFTDPDPDGSMRSEEYTVRAKVKGRTKLWRDWTKQERTDMGEIVDARYTVGKTFALLARDLATGEFFEELANSGQKDGRHHRHRVGEGAGHQGQDVCGQGLRGARRPRGQGGGVPRPVRAQ